MGGNQYTEKAVKRGASAPRLDIRLSDAEMVALKKLSRLIDASPNSIARMALALVVAMKPSEVGRMATLYDTDPDAFSAEMARHR